MSRTLFLITAAALLASPVVFAQSSTTAPDPNTAAAPATSSPSDETKPAKGPRHHRAHSARSEKGAGTDWDADKLNACMPDANPTPQQLDCIRQAANKPS